MCDDVDLSLYGTMDGHGEFGHLVSSFVKEELPKFLADEGVHKLKSDPRGAILSATQNLCQALTKRNKINIQFSGTTAVFSLRVGTRLFTANIGDSRCVLCSRNVAVATANTRTSGSSSSSAAASAGVSGALLPPPSDLTLVSPRSPSNSSSTAVTSSPSAIPDPPAALRI